MSTRADYPATEAAALAWLCDCALPEVESAARVLRIRFNPRKLLPLRSVARVAYHLGTILEARPRGQYDLTRNAGLVKVLLPSPEDGCTYVDLHAVRAVCTPEYSGVELLLWTGEWFTREELEAWHNRERPGWRYASMLVPVGRVHE